MTVADSYKGEIASNAVVVTFNAVAVTFNAVVVTFNAVVITLNAVAVTLNVSVTTHYVSVPEGHAVSRDSEQKKHLAKRRIIYPDNCQPTTKY